MVCEEPLTLVGVYVTEHEPEDSIQLVGAKFPDPLVVKVSTVPVGVGEPELITVITQVDGLPTVTGLEQATIVVVEFGLANAGLGEKTRQTITNSKAIESATELNRMLTPIPFSYLPT